MQSNCLGLAVEHEGQIRFCQKTSETGGTAKKKQTFKTQFAFYWNNGKRKVLRRKETAHDLNNIRLSIKHGGRNVMAWVWMAASGTRPLVFLEVR